MILFSIPLFTTYALQLNLLEISSVVYAHAYAHVCIHIVSIDTNHSSSKRACSSV